MGQLGGERMLVSEISPEPLRRQRAGLDLPLDLESTLSKGRPDPWGVPIPPPAHPSSGLARGPEEALPALTPDGSDLFQHRGPLGPGARAVVCSGHSHAIEEQLHSSIVRRREV